MIREMESIHFPIKDKWVPPSMEGLIYLIDTIIERMKAGKTVICHCNGGKGRTGTGSFQHFSFFHSLSLSPSLTLTTKSNKIRENKHQ
jgi:protein tyrosine phosphatase